MSFRRCHIIGLWLWGEGTYQFIASISALVQEEFIMLKEKSYFRIISSVNSVDSYRIGTSWCCHLIIQPVFFHIDLFGSNKTILRETLLWFALKSFSLLHLARNEIFQENVWGWAVKLGIFVAKFSLWQYYQATFPRWAGGGGGALYIV